MLCPGCKKNPAYVTKREWDYCDACSKSPRRRKKSDADKAAEKERARFMDTNMKNDEATTVLWIALTAKDLENLRKAAEKHPSRKNFAALVRMLIQREAK